MSHMEIDNLSNPDDNFDNESDKENDPENMKEIEFDYEDDNAPVNPEDEAEEAPDTNRDDQNKSNVVKPKKVVKNPQPKLDAMRLMGPRGIGILPNKMNELKYKGKDHEKEDLDLLMKNLEHWGHRLFPKLPFDDFIFQMEKLGTKKPVQVLVKKMRLDLMQTNDTMEDVRRGPELIDEPIVERDAFDDLIQSTSVPLMERIEKPSKPTITEEMKERMERNRLLALERRRSKLQNANNTLNSSQSSQNENATSNQDTQLENALNTVSISDRQKETEDMLTEEEMLPAI